MSRPFRCEIPQPVLDDLARRLTHTRPAPTPPTPAWEAGTDPAWLAGLLEHWRRRFDWRAWEARLNSWEQVMVEVDGMPVHAIHHRSPHTGAFPLVLTHGWPGSVMEFLEVLGPLTDPTAHGGRAEDAFHVVCPSIPGYGFSPAPTRPGYDIREVGRTVAGLMRALGYERYGAQGGDWGAMATGYTALADPNRCVAIHLNMVLASRPKDEDPRATLSQRELADLEQAREYMRHGTGYQWIQSTRPQTLGYGLEDSPAGLAAWIGEKFREWTDCGSDPDNGVARDWLLANITLYWVTATATSSARLYFESRRSGRFGPVDSYVDTPTACAIFPAEMFRPPRRWAERHYNVVRWTEMTRGGHFAAMEAPELLVADIREFFRDYR